VYIGTKVSEELVAFIFRVIQEDHISYKVQYQLRFNRTLFAATEIKNDNHSSEAGYNLISQMLCVSDILESMNNIQHNDH